MYCVKYFFLVIIINKLKFVYFRASFIETFLRRLLFIEIDNYRLYKHTYILIGILLNILIGVAGT